MHGFLKANLIGMEMMKRIALSEQLVRDSQLEACNWKEQYESLQIDVEYLEESKSTLEQRVRALISELAVEKASSSQADKEKARLETSFSEQLSKASEEIRELKALLGEKDAYAGELVQNLTQAQEDLRASSDKDKSAIEVSWAFLNSRRDTLVEASQETFDLESELAKINETIEKAQQTQDFPSLVDEASVNVEVDMGIPTPSSPVEPAAVNPVEPAAVDASSSAPTSS
ncbi:tropomyosin-2-like [Nicotiana sylvestris]|uniref:tropomyosin-2-like n=1 Tax=Nicotiana sylvestris TaxID=4096 RepID=UPI00388C7058